MSAAYTASAHSAFGPSAVFAAHDRPWLADNEPDAGLPDSHAVLRPHGAIAVLYLKPHCHASSSRKATDHHLEVATAGAALLGNRQHESSGSSLLNTSSCACRPKGHEHVEVGALLHPEER